MKTNLDLSPLKMVFTAALSEDRPVELEFVVIVAIVPTYR